MIASFLVLFAPEIAMSKLIGSAFTIALLCIGISVANAGDGEWVTCKDGLKVRGDRACEHHGGVVIPMNVTPINANDSVTPNKKVATSKKVQAQRTASAAKPKKTAARRTNTPTAKCMDGAMYFSTERRGACLKHGGVKTWY